LQIGIDFDNTIVSYDHVFAAEAKTKGLIPDDFNGTKTEIRDHIRTLEDGETEWQRLQGRVYGSRMPEARLIDGVIDFLAGCRERGYPIFIVSHKTQFGQHDPDRVDLRETALNWMESQAFFEDNGYGIERENVVFEPTRQQKVARIKTLGCSYFIDDLVEVFSETGFPDGIERYLFHPGPNAPKGPFKVFSSWYGISDDIFSRTG